jgi:hypothetical protein
MRQLSGMPLAYSPAHRPPRLYPRRSNPIRAAALAAALALFGATTPVCAQDGLLPGQAFVTKFSGTATVDGRTVIDLAGAVGNAIDLRAPRFQPDGRHWFDKPVLFSVTAGDVGQVFGVTLDDANPPNIYLTATSAFGLHRNADNSDWLAGMWGPGGGPGTIYRLSAANRYQPEVFANVTLNGRANSGAALGNIAYDRWHHQFYVSDLETGMIHRLALADGADRGSYDHGATGRARFVDGATNATRSLPPVAFNPAATARVADCPSGDFTRTPSCWNFADFRRRVWGLDVRGDATGKVRLYYAVWGSQGFGNPDWAAAGDDQKNSVWSIAIADDGSFDTASVRREFILPEFFRAPEATARAGISNPVTDIAFPSFGQQNVMLVAERGGVRNLGLEAEEAFSYPHEARVLRYELTPQGAWRPVGRYDVGFYDRKNEGPPYLRAGAAGGAAFGMGYDAQGQVDPTKPDGFVWMTGDALCSEDGPCVNPATGAHSDRSRVSGLQGIAQSNFQELAPAAALRPYPATGPALPPTGPDRSYMIDADVTVDSTGNVLADKLARNDATRIGDVVVYQQEVAAKKLDLMVAKRALDGSCTPGGPCRFEIVISNVGDLPYSGPLVLIDVGGSGSTMTVPPPPDWTCTQQFSGSYICNHAPVDLAPGASISFQVTFQIPGWWSRPVFDNCVDLTTPGTGVDARLYNNKACGYAPTGPSGPDLQLSKFGLDGQCDWFNNCLFVVRVTNVGGAPYSGPLTIHDNVMFGGLGLTAWAPGSWVCGPIGATSFNCTHPPVTLSPGEFREVVVWIAGAPILPGHTHVRNCAFVTWGAIPRDANPGNEYDCATISRFPPGFPGAGPALDVSKQALPLCFKGAGPGDSWLCVYNVTITNIGGAPQFGPLQFSDVVDFSPLPATLTLVAAPWGCVPGIGAGGPQVCTRPGVPGGLQPGQSVTAHMHFSVPAAAVPGFVRNCATVKSDHDGDGIAEDHVGCGIAVLCDPATGPCPSDLAITKTVAPGPCFPGFPCAFSVAVTNLSTVPYAGPVVLSDTPDPGVGLMTVTGPAGWLCLGLGGGYGCTWPGGIPPGGTVWLDVQFPIPADHPGPSFKNCANIAPGPGNAFAFNDTACATAFVPFPDLAPFGGTTCQRGANCTLDVSINNKGLLPFIGRAGIRGTLSPAVPIGSVTAVTPGLACRIAGSSYECEGGRLSIPPGGAARIRIVIAVPADFAGDSINHAKEMIWPDPAVKDKRPENDRHVSIITIAARGPITCVGGAVRNSECVCPQGTQREQSGPNAYRCVAPPVTCNGGTVRNNQCVCPEGTLRQQTGPNAYTCGPPPLVCLGGAVQNNQCVCPQGSNPQQTAPNSYRCVAIPVTCTDGTVRNNQCVCPQGTYPQQTGPYAFRCVAPPIVCVGGTVQNNQCVCPQGTHPDRTGPTSYRCVATIVCVGGAVRENQCVCPEGTQRQQTGTNSYRCVAPPIVCLGGTLRNNQCVCPEGNHPEQTATNAYRCVPTTVCTGGTVRNNQCVCPTGSQPQQTGPNAYRCTVPLVCVGGAVRNNQCVCPQGSQPQQTGPNAYRCVRQIVCVNGTVHNNECVCPQGTQRQQNGPNAFTCVKPQVACVGGTVQNNQCVCPQGMNAQPTGPNAYRCVPPPLTCVGGTVQNNQCNCPAGSRPQQTGPNAFRCVTVIR